MQVLAGGQPIVEQGGVGDIAQARADAGQVLARIQTEDLEPALGGTVQGGQGGEQRGLAGAVGAQ